MTKAMRGKLARLEAQQGTGDYQPPTFCLPVSNWHPAGAEIAPGCYASTYYRRPSVAYESWEQLQAYIESQPAQKFMPYKIVET
jgi:hypothetical protein